MAGLRVAIVGSGNMAGQRIESFQALEGVTISALAARNPETGRSMAEAHGLALVTDWRDLLNQADLDALVVTTHNKIHGEICLAALDAGVHIFTEYPITRSLEEAAILESRLAAETPVLAVAHDENGSADHAVLRRVVPDLGPMLLALFTRITPGRGARPEVLFNLNLTGPPALFFIYHVYALVDVFGPAAWVDCGARYTGLGDDGGYQRFSNALTVGFREGGIANWNWAGGVEIAGAEQAQQIVLEGGTLVRGNEGWTLSTRTGVEVQARMDSPSESLEERFVRHCLGDGKEWKEETQTAINAARIGLAAEVAVTEGRRVTL